ncbi:MAG: hypothetical protein ACHQ51_05445 [Elusimicrobiota bacterium]
MKLIALLSALVLCAASARPASAADPVVRLQKLAAKVRALKGSVTIKPSKKAAARAAGAKSAKAGKIPASNKATKATALRSLYRQLAVRDLRSCLSSSLPKAGVARVKSSLRSLRVAGERLADDEATTAFPDADLDNDSDLADACGCGTGMAPLGEDSYGLCYCADSADASFAAAAADSDDSSTDVAVSSVAVSTSAVPAASADPIFSTVQFARLSHAARAATKALSSRETPKAVAGAKVSAQARLHFSRAMTYQRMAAAATRPLFPSKAPTSAALKGLARTLRAGRGPIAVSRPLAGGGYRSVMIPRSLALKKTYRAMAALDYRAALVAGLPAAKAGKAEMGIFRIAASASGVRRKAKKSARKAGVKIADDDGEDDGGGDVSYSAPDDPGYGDVSQSDSSGYDSSAGDDSTAALAPDDSGSPDDSSATDAVAYQGADDTSVSADDNEGGDSSGGDSAPTWSNDATDDSGYAGQNIVPLTPFDNTPLVDPGSDDPAPSGDASQFADTWGATSDSLTDALVSGPDVTASTDDGTAPSDDGTATATDGTASADDGAAATADSGDDATSQEPVVTLDDGTGDGGSAAVTDGTAAPATPDASVSTDGTAAPDPLDGGSCQPDSTTLSHYKGGKKAGIVDWCKQKLNQGVNYVLNVLNSPAGQVPAWSTPAPDPVLPAQAPGQSDDDYFAQHKNDICVSHGLVGGTLNCPKNWTPIGTSCWLETKEYKCADLTLRGRVRNIAQACPASSKAIAGGKKSGFVMCAVQRKSSKAAGPIKGNRLYSHLAKLEKAANRYSKIVSAKAAKPARKSAALFARAQAYEKMAAAIPVRGRKSARKSAKANAPPQAKKAEARKAAVPKAAVKKAVVAEDVAPAPGPDAAVSPDSAATPDVAPAPDNSPAADPIKAAEQEMNDQEKDMDQEIQKRLPPTPAGK